MRLVNTGNNIYASKESYYNVHTRSLTRAALRATHNTMKHLQGIMVLPDDQKVVVKKLSEEHDGEFAYISQTISITPFRSNLYDFIETLCHEAVHAEQYFMNRTGFLLKEDGTYIRYGAKLYQVADDGTYQGEDNPWEREAYNRQEKLASSVCDAIFGGTHVARALTLGME